MTEVVFAVRKLRDLFEAAKTAKTEYDKAAVFAAVAVIADFLDAEIGKRDDYVGENIDRARDSISAIVGYGPAGGHEVLQHSSWALAAVMFLEGKVG